MILGRWLAGAALAVTSVWVLAQDAPESLLPPGFDEPAPAPSPAPKPAPSPAPTPAPAPAKGASPRPAPAPVSSPVVQAISDGEGAASDSIAGAEFDERKLPTLEELEAMAPEELEEALGLKPKYDIPPAARRSMRRVGIIGQEEGGFPSASLSNVNPSLIRAAIAANRGRLVSRWGHILLRRALASRLDAPARMKPADFAGLRAALLLRMGEAEAARALVQDIDTGNFTPSLADAAFNSFVATADITGICPAMATQGGTRDNEKWELARTICRAFRGESRNAMLDLDRELSRGNIPKIDVLLAQKYAGAAGRVRRAVTIEWDDVDKITPWRYGLTIAVGLELPESLMEKAGSRYAYYSALAPMLGLGSRAKAADLAGGAGILSSRAMIDLYSQIYADSDMSGEWAQRAESLRDAYVATDPAARLAAMQQLWNSTDGAQQRYSRQVLTAYAAARMPVDEQLAPSAHEIIASMLTAGLDQNALRWAEVSEAGSLAWAQLALAAPRGSSPVDSGALDRFFDDDESAGAHKSALLLAGLAGLGRITPGTANQFESRLGIELEHESRWTRTIGAAAASGNASLVALLATLGMQGSGWDKMTPRYLFAIVSALREVGLDAEARMIAAEAVARA